MGAPFVSASVVEDGQALKSHLQFLPFGTSVQCCSIHYWFLPDSNFGVAHRTEDAGTSHSALSYTNTVK
jgi:hypothetical protein